MIEELGSVVGLVAWGAVVEFFGWPKSLVAALVLLFWIGWHKDRHWVFLWVLYGFAFWATDLGRDDNAALLVLTTLVHVSMLIAGHLLPPSFLTDPRLGQLASVFLVIPLACNNLFFHPWVAMFRIVVFYVAEFFFDGKRRWLTTPYLLFSKAEALIPLMASDVIVRLLVKKYGEVIPVLPTRTSQPPQQQQKSFFTTILESKD